MASYHITVIPGDGIGPEVMAEALKVLRASETVFPGLRFECKEYPAGARCYKETGSDLPAETLEACRKADAILFGSTGDPSIRFADGTEIAPQLTLRFVLDLYAGIRPIKRYAGVPPTLAGDPAIDYVIMRENCEGLYASRGAGVRVGEQVAVDNMVITRSGTERIVRYAFRLAQQRRGAPADTTRRVTCVDKANVLKSMAFFRQIFYEVAREFPGTKTEHAYVDAMTMYMVQRPLHFDVVVAENMFGDIISDLAAGTVGGLGLAPSADVGDTYGLFQPSHGTAPDIAGKGIANPTAQILSAGMMLTWLGERKNDSQAREAAMAIERAVEETLADRRYHTADLGGQAKTGAVGDAVASRIGKN
ncbi:MAG TPA: isocitrate/isopropylmalate dehydrogenase family protein [Candidatus Methylomirabilis sp.]|nr:isocitrate/isopropylmalate dehydrogenase family protein [Candidatus Methylomirabilis sp.]